MLKRSLLFVKEDCLICEIVTCVLQDRRFDFEVVQDSVPEWVIAFPTLLTYIGDQTCVLIGEGIPQELKKLSVDFQVD